MTVRNVRVTFDSVLVTGGAGFIGSHTVDALLHEGVRVWVLDDFSSGSQLSAEKYCHVYHSAHALNVVSLRYFNVYGERQSSNPYSGVVAIFTKRLLAGLPLTIYGDGEQVRDFIHVSDVARANLLALESRKAAGVAVNVGTGKATTIRSLAATLSVLAGRRNIRSARAPARPGDIRSSCADILLARRVLGFKPDVSLREGLGHVLEWFREQQH